MNRIEVNGLFNDFYRESDEGSPGALSHGTWLSGDDAEDEMIRGIEGDEEDHVVWNPMADGYDNVSDVEDYLMLVDDASIELDEPIGLVPVGGYTGAKAIPRTIKQSREISMNLEGRWFRKGKGKKPIIIPRENRRHARQASAA